jgi:hypothetical protein
MGLGGDARLGWQGLAGKAWRARLGGHARLASAQRQYQAPAAECPRRESRHAKYRRLRQAAYADGFAEYDELVLVPTFRDFVALYVAEGHKRNRNRVSIGDSDERVIALAAGWLRRLTSKPPWYCVQYHADQKLEELQL